MVLQRLIDVRTTNDSQVSDVSESSPVQPFNPSGGLFSVRPVFGHPLGHSGFGGSSSMSSSSYNSGASPMVTRLPDHFSSATRDLNASVKKRGIVRCVTRDPSEVMEEKKLSMVSLLSSMNQLPEFVKCVKKKMEKFIDIFGEISRRSNWSTLRKGS